ncbi:MAG TPA: SDR family oxidoreductase [Verrucomicrobiae bacterium]|jgi:short-subunit dehydrogenase|nr:SDR family oxidoreductase [Verrucomicrobiae bacterium]
MTNEEVVVITGASGGVGRATARYFAARGAKIGLLARGRDRLEAAQREVEELGGKAVIVIADVAKSEEVEAAAQSVEDNFGPIDIWVNNAMASVFSRFLDLTPEEFRRITEVTYFGAVHGTMAALRRMAARNYGTIVQVGSALSYRSIPLQSGYCGAKHALRGFTDSLRSELIHDGIDVHLTMVQLPALNTPQFTWARNHMSRQPQPVGPIYQPEVAAEAIYWAAHHRRREVCVGVPTVAAIVANKMMPASLDHYLAHTSVEGQLTEEPYDPDQPDNLWQPPPGDYGARGHFNDHALTFSPQLWFTKNRNWLALAAAGLAGIGCGVAVTRKLHGKNEKARG